MKGQNDNQKVTEELSTSLSTSSNSLESNFDDILSRMRLACGVKTDKELARFLGVKYPTIKTTRHRGTIPSAWYVAVAHKFGASMDWLRTGEGEMKRGGGMIVVKKGALPNEAMATAEQERAATYNDRCRRDISIADMLAKTARVLESDTVYREALYSNIEAFYHGVSMDERLSKMDSKFDQVSQRLDALEAENQQLRHELEESRSQLSVRDTG